jgi:D-alanyl-lipoteichoic acid acyltransferase DltB (MBOAT superfamily)
MLFNSFEFAIFLPLVFVLYWFVFNKKLTLQNSFLLLSSYIFYGWWDWRFLFLLMFSTFLDYFTGLKIYDAGSKRKKKMWLLISIVINLGFLALFKYYNFFIGSFSEALNSVGLHANVWTLSIILPVGISFYTFHGLSYVLDLYNDKIPPTRNFIDYSLFVSFFPLLVAGPIERAQHLLPQVQKTRTFNYSNAADGVRQMLWGFFKKVVIADNCAPLVNDIFSNYQSASGSELIFGAVLFAFQIYGDFSGYSDIALGTARLFGFELLTNFRVPYFSRDIAEFWRRWHISLSSWFRDYLYFPLGGSRQGLKKAILNTIIIFLVSGLWHGANWTFIAWGALNALYFLPLLALQRNRSNIDTVAQGRSFPSIRELSQMGLTFGLVCLAWIFFRAETIHDAVSYIAGIGTHRFLPASWNMFKPSLIVLIGVLVLLEWVSREEGMYRMLGNIKSPVFRHSMYVLLLSLMGLYGAFTESQFIYFQF